jgi:hypothetical protein
MQALAEIFHARHHNGFDFGGERGGNLFEAALGEADFGVGDLFGFIGADTQELDFAGLRGEAVVDAREGGDDIGRQFTGRCRGRAGFGEGNAGLDAIEPFEQRCEAGPCGTAMVGSRLAAAESESGTDCKSGTGGDGNTTEKRAGHGVASYSVYGSWPEMALSPDETAT